MRISAIIGTAVLLLAACSNSGGGGGGHDEGQSGGMGAVAGSLAATAGSSGTDARGGAGTGGTSGSGGAPFASGNGGATSSGGGSGTFGSGGMSASGGTRATAGSSGSGGGVQGGASGTSTAGAGMGVGGGAGASTGTAGASFVQPSLVTSADGAYWVTSGMLTEVDGGTADVTVNDASTAQTWAGFGGSFNEKGWSYLTLLSEADRNKALALLFGRDGLNFTWGRIPIGATDYSMDRYSLDEVPAGESDPSMAHFSIDRDQQQLIPYVKAALAVKSDIHFWSSPWSPPTWMKDGPFNDDSPFDGGSIKSDDTTQSALALYFVKFIQAYQAAGIDIELIAPQNEPGYSGNYPTCAWEPKTYASFVGQRLAPALSQAGLNVKIMLGTFNGGTGDSSIVTAVMGDPTASAAIAVLGYQWGMQSSAKGDQKYMRPIWQSEHKCGNYPWDTANFDDKLAPNDHAYAVESWGLLRDWIKTGGVAGYDVWNMVLDTVGNGIDSKRVWPQDALLTVDTTAKTLTITPAYYVFRHLSQFVEPGAVVLGTTGGDAMAFKNPDGTVITVMYNSGAAKTYVVAVGGKKLQFQMPSGGWATVRH